MTCQFSNTAENKAGTGASAPTEAPLTPEAASRASETGLRIVCFQFDPNICGPHVRARGVFRKMAEDGHVTRVVIPAGPGSAEAFYDGTGIEVDRLAIRKPVSPTNKLAFMLYLLALPIGVARTFAYLRRQRPDVVHVNGAYDLVPAFACRLAGLPLIWHLIDTAPSRPVARILGRIVSLLATRVIFVASAVASHYGVRPERSSLIFEPVDPDHFRARNLAGRPNSPAVIGLLANWNPLKGQDRFIDVIRLLRKRGHAVRGRVMGALNERQSHYWRPLLARIEEAGLGSDIERLGFVDDTAAALAGIDIMLLTSRSEACPICVLEAMSIGVPQVCFKVGGVAELLGTDSGTPAGLTVLEGDVEAMSDAVERILSEPSAYRQYALAGQERARTLFSLERCVSAHLAIYRNAISSRSKHGDPATSRSA